MKREREASVDETLPNMAAAAAAAATGNSDAQAAFEEAEILARERLIQAVKALPPKSLFSPEALAAFKAQHLAQMRAEQGIPPHPLQSGGSRTPPPP